MLNMKYVSLMFQKVHCEDLETDTQINRQSDRQTDRFDRNNMPLIIQSGHYNKQTEYQCIEDHVTLTV